MTESIQPYTISISNDALQELMQRLAWAKLPTQLESPEQNAWDFGVPIAKMQRLVTYWKEEFDWRRAESKLNELPHYHTDIEVEGFGVLNIHCKPRQSIMWRPTNISKSFIKSAP